MDRMKKGDTNTTQNVFYNEKGDFTGCKLEKSKLIVSLFFKENINNISALIKSKIH